MIVKLGVSGSWSTGSITVFPGLVRVTDDSKIGCEWVGVNRQHYCFSWFGESDKIGCEWVGFDR